MTESESTSSEFLDSVRKGVMLGAAVLVLVWPPSRQAAPAAPSWRIGTDIAQPARPSVAPTAGPRRADFAGKPASPDARMVADWALHSGDHQGRAVVVVDKREAQVFVFDPQGRLLGATPALLGSAVGDHTVPGVGDKPIAQVLPEERTTPAGRFIAEPGMNTNGEDVVWVDYDAAVSMHRVRPNVKAERRLERLASATAEDNRISYGCINLPVAFYEGVLSPTVRSTGAVVYVLPEAQSAMALFGAYPVPAASTQLAAR